MSLEKLKKEIESSSWTAQTLRLIWDYIQALEGELASLQSRREDKVVDALIKQRENGEAIDALHRRVEALEKAAKPVEENSHEGMRYSVQFNSYWMCSCGKKFPGKVSDYRDYLCDCDKPSRKPTEAEKPKPKQKIVRYVNMFKCGIGGVIHIGDVMHTSRQEADNVMPARWWYRIGCKRVEIDFEEGEFDD